MASGPTRTPMMLTPSSAHGRGGPIARRGDMSRDPTFWWGTIGSYRYQPPKRERGSNSTPSLADTMSVCYLRIDTDRLGFRTFQKDAPHIQGV